MYFVSPITHFENDGTVLYDPPEFSPQSEL